MGPDASGFTVPRERTLLHVLRVTREDGYLVTLGVKAAGEDRAHLAGAAGDEDAEHLESVEERIPDCNIPDALIVIQIFGPEDGGVELLGAVDDEGVPPGELVLLLNDYGL